MADDLILICRGGYCVLPPLLGEVSAKQTEGCKTIPPSFPYGNATQLLRYPKIPTALRLVIFDRGAKPCSLFRPQGALHRLCSLHKGGLPSGFLVLPSSVSLRLPPSPGGRLSCGTSGTTFTTFAKQKAPQKRCFLFYKINRKFS